MIDQLIRKYLLEYEQKNKSSLIAEDKSQSGWTIELLDYKSIKNQRANDKARKAGAQSGLAIVATKPKKAITTDSLLETDILNLLEKGNVRYTGFPFNAKNHLFVLMKVKDKPNRKIWNLWAIDKNITGINQTSEQIKKILQSTKYSTTTSQNIDRLQGITMMSYTQAEAWFKILQKQQKELDIKTKLKLPNLESIKDDVTADVNLKLKSQQVEIVYTDDAESFNVYSVNKQLLTNVEDTNGFIGTAYMTVSADGESLTFEPIDGTQGVREYESNRSGLFIGKFENGAPYDGNIQWNTPEEESEDVIEFTGRLNSKIKTKFNDKQDFTFNMLNGVAKFNNGFIYNGTWDQTKYYDRNFKTGELFNKEGKLVGKYTDGKFESVKSNLELQQNTSETPEENIEAITYPYNWLTSDAGTIVVYNDANTVYYLHDNSFWLSCDKQEFENKIQSNEAITFIPVIGEPEQVKLDGLFSKTRNSARPVTPPPAPRRKTKYVVMTASRVNLYYRNSNGTFKFTSGADAASADKTTGHKLLDTKKGKIQGRTDNTEYTMYYFKDTSGRGYWIPSTYAKIVER